MTLGVYAFTLSDWKEKDYPLDLWLQWTSRFVDEIGLLYIGDDALKDIDIPDNARINYAPYSRFYNANMNYAIMKESAETLLRTDWRMMLDIDEFITKRPTLRESNIYIHNLFGDVFHEIFNTGISTGALPWLRLHNGFRKVVKDGCTVEGEGFRSDPIIIYHTTLLRNPLELANRTYYWKINRRFDYRHVKDFWKDAIIKEVNPHNLPKILLDNKDRFEYCKDKRLLK